ncbi:MAG: nitroreductase [Pseudomonadota bacterium]
MTMHDNPIIDFMLRRRSVLAGTMAEPGPTDADLETMLAVATRVPDHGKLEPWRIQVLRKPAQRELAEVFTAAFMAATPDATDAQIDAARQRLQRSPLLLVVSCQPRPDRFEKVPHIEQQLSAGAVCDHLLIAAGALGYAAQWLTGAPAYTPSVKAALGLDENADIVGFMHFGSVIDAPRERPRPTVSDIVSEWQGDVS